MKDPVHIAVHEASHAAAGWLLGFRVAPSVESDADRFGVTLLDLTPTFEALVESDRDEAWIRKAVVAAIGSWMVPQEADAEERRTSDWQTVERARSEVSSPDLRSLFVVHLERRLQQMAALPSFRLLQGSFASALERRERLSFDESDELAGRVLGAWN